MLQNFGGQGKVFGQFFQHFFVGAGRAGGGFFDHGQAQFAKKYLANLLGAAQVKRLAGQGVGLGLQLHNAGAQSLALRGQRGRVNQHAVALDAVERLAAVDFQLVNKGQTCIGLHPGPKRLVHFQGHVGVFAGVLGGAGDIDLVKADLVCTLAAHVFKTEPAAAQVALSQTLQTVRLVHLNHIALQHGVVHITTHLDAVVGKHMAVVFDVLA